VDFPHGVKSQVCSSRLASYV